MSKAKAKKTVKREGVTDFHLHMEPWHLFKPEIMERIQSRRPDADLISRFVLNPGDFLRHLDEAGIRRACLVNCVTPEITGAGAEVNEWVSEYCSHAPDRLLAVGSIHPRLVLNVDVEMERLCGDLEIRMIKLHPPHQSFYPNEYRDGLHALGAIYRKAQEFRVPVMIHTGTSIFKGARNKYGQPIHCDDLGVDFPELRVILAHGGRPLWMDEAFFLIRRHENFFLDISSIPIGRLLTYFPRLEEVADKVLFGSDWPGPGVGEIGEALRAFEGLPLSESAKRKILSDNAMKLLP